MKSYVIKGYKVVGLTNNIWAVVVPGFHQDFVYLVTEHFGSITITDNFGEELAEFDNDSSFATIMQEGSTCPMALLEVVCREYIKRHLR